MLKEYSTQIQPSLSSTGLQDTFTLLGKSKIEAEASRILIDLANQNTQHYLGIYFQSKP